MFLFGRDLQSNGGQLQCDMRLVALIGSVTATIYKVYTILPMCSQVHTKTYSEKCMFIFMCSLITTFPVEVEGLNMLKRSIHLPDHTPEYFRLWFAHNTDFGNFVTLGCFIVW